MSRIDREILRLTIPSILANITVPLVGMADIAVSGHLGSVAEGFGAAALVGGIAVGSMIFDLLYWNFSFLRTGTGGLTAQAYGRGDIKACRDIFSRAISLALLSGLLLVAVQWLVVQAGFLLADCTPEVRHFAERYFYIRIWAAPATLSLFAFKGWFIGMQDSVSPMAADILVNLLNIFLSIVLTFGLGPWRGIGFDGVALGTLISQWTGFAFAVGVILLKYRRKVFVRWRPAELLEVLKGGREMRSFFSMNADLVVRSLAMLCVYVGFTAISTRMGDVLLATGAILMKLLMIFSYFTDGFAYAGEAMSGRFIGEKDGAALKATIRPTFAWSMSIAVLFIGLYHFAGVPLLRMMTSDTDVVSAATPYLPWLMAMPLLGCPAFTWDGIFIGATLTKPLRDNAVWATLAFFAVWLAGSFIPGLSPQGAMHLLMGAYFAHLAVRTIYLSLYYSKKGIAISGAAD